jgi:hypothetical protein
MIDGSPAVNRFDRTGRRIWQLSIGRADDFVRTANPRGTTRDEYCSADSYTEFDMSLWSPSTYSNKWLQSKVTGNNAASSGYSMAFALYQTHSAVVSRLRPGWVGVHSLVRVANRDAVRALAFKPPGSPAAKHSDFHIFM